MNQWMGATEVEVETHIREINDLHGDFEAMMVGLIQEKVCLRREMIQRSARRLRLWDDARQWLGSLCINCVPR